ncbi:hypothetical protein M1403_03395 [Patescibacteria group bacterium]|nr:hypothetical protein [Patescibacteria group bacterium]
MRALALLLHFYQPPTQSQTITEQVLRSCYLPLADLLLAHPEARFTLNIAVFPSPDFTAKIKLLLDRGQVELTNSPIHHPLLPLLAATEIPQLLEANRARIKEVFGYEPGNLIYLPELGVKPEIYQENMIIDESSVNSDFNPDKIPPLPKNVSSRAVSELLRSYPNELTGDIFLKFFEAKTAPDQTILAVSDAEVFGHHYTERINLLRELLETKKIKFIKASEIPDSGNASRLTLDTVRASTWQTSAADLKNNNPYPLWLSPDNPLQNKYDQLAKLAYQLLQKSPDSNPPAEGHYQQGISSCHYYWLSNWPWWHPDLVELGARELIRCVRSLYIDTALKIPAEKLYHEFLMEMWSYHWSGEVEKKYAAYNQARAKFLDKLPRL